MKEKCLQLVASILLGLVLPGFVIRLTAPAQEQKIPEATKPTVHSDEVPAPGIWVLMGNENIQWMVLEEYLIGVILAEMPTSYEHEALCAQAVVARTYALKRQGGERHPKGAVCADPACCQAYVEVAQYLDGLGYPEDVDRARAAVEATAGMVVTYENQLIEATYFHCSGGHTEDAAVVWGVDYPYLQAQESPGEEGMEGYYARTFFPRTELEKLLGRELPGNPSGWIGWTTYTVGNGVETMLFAGVQYSGIQFRSLLGLNSTNFSVEAQDDGLWITTYGKGHRVGMSQTGSQAMALQGCTWQQIIEHYYPGTRIDKMEDVG